MRRGAKTIAVVGMLCACGASAWSAGFYSPGFPDAGQLPGTLPFTGNETFAVDTNLPGGQPPQTEAVTFAQLASYLGGSGGGTSYLTSSQSSVIVASANTFQSAAASNSTRHGCMIQYTGSTVGYVYFGANGSATKGSSFLLPPGGSLSCGVSGGILTDNLAVTSATAGDTFVVNVN